MVRRIVTVLVLVAALGACGGGGGKTEETIPDEGDGEEVEPDDDGGMIPPERMDAITNDLNRKRQTASRCLTEAIDAGDADKNSRGKITLEFVIAASGKPRDISVVNATLKSKMVQDCVVELVGNMDFGALPRDLDWSYTFAFEAF